MRHFSKAVLLAVVFCWQASHTHAQFLKKIINTVKQTAGGDANNKPNEASNKSNDNAGGALSGKPSKHSSTDSLNIDTAATNSVLGAFVKAARDNPNDTSASDLVKKALGNLVGGGGVSHEDSVKAIESFRHGSGGSGYVYMYVMSITAKSIGNKKDTMTEYLCNSGNARSEVGIPLPGSSHKRFVTLARAGQPQYSITLNEENKTYSLNVIDTSLINHAGGLSSYKAVKVGTETVDGFTCTHAKLTSTSGGGMFKSSSTMDVWTSVGVPGYALIKRIMSAGNITPAMIRALDDAGCGGMLVKMSSQSKDSQMVDDLIKTQTKNLPTSMFEIPAGYKESDENMISNLFHH